MNTHLLVFLSAALISMVFILVKKQRNLENIEAHLSHTQYLLDKAQRDISALLSRIADLSKKYKKDV